MPMILIGGGSRSGKSRYALVMAKQRFAERRYFLATAEPLDGEMSERIRRHRDERGADFATVEEPFEIDRPLDADVVVVDCLTLWVSNLMMAGRVAEWEERLARMASSALTRIVVTNEVGSGIVPDNALAREFRDLAGSVNQRAAALAEEAYFMAFGLPVRLK